MSERRWRRAAALHADLMRVEAVLEFVSMIVDAAPVTPRERSPWLTMWFSPRRTVRSLIDSNPQRSWVPVAVLAGINQAFIWLNDHYGALSTDPASTAFQASWRVGFLVFGIFVGSFILALVGGWLGGHGDADDVRQGLGWSYVPLAATAILWIPQVLVYGSDAFNPNKPYETLVQWATLPLELAIGVAILWCVPLAIAALAEALHVSILRSIAVLTLAALPVLLLALLR